MSHQFRLTVGKAIIIDVLASDAPTRIRLSMLRSIHFGAVVGFHGPESVVFTKVELIDRKTPSTSRTAEDATSTLFTTMNDTTNGSMYGRQIVKPPSPDVTIYIRVA